MHLQLPSFLDTRVLQLRIGRPAHQKFPLVFDRRCPLQHAHACSVFLKLYTIRIPMCTNYIAGITRPTFRKSNKSSFGHASMVKFISPSNLCCQRLGREEFQISILMIVIIIIIHSGLFPSPFHLAFPFPHCSPWIFISFRSRKRKNRDGLKKAANLKFKCCVARRGG